MLSGFGVRLPRVRGGLWAPGGFVSDLVCVQLRVSLVYTDYSQVFDAVQDRCLNLCATHFAGVNAGTALLKKEGRRMIFRDSKC